MLTSRLTSPSIRLTSPSIRRALVVLSPSFFFILCVSDRPGWPSSVHFFFRSVLAPSLLSACNALATVRQFSCRDGCTAYRPTNSTAGVIVNDALMMDGVCSWLGLMSGSNQFILISGCPAPRPSVNSEKGVRRGG